MEVKTYRDKWKGTLTDRERFNNQMHYRPVDRCFNMEFGYWDENFQRWPLFKDNHITNNQQANVFWGFDKMAHITPIEMNPVFEEKIIEQTDSTNLIINRDGLLAEVPRDGHATIPHFLKSSIRTPQDWQCMKQERFRLDDPARKVDVESIRKQHPAERDYPIGVVTGSMIGRIRDLLTMEGLCFACYDYPDMVEDMVETYCRLTEDFLDQTLPWIDYDFAVGWEDICCNSGPLVSIPFFKEVLVPRYKRIHRKLKDHGIDIWFIDCDGDIRSIIPLFLEAGVNTMFPLEVNGSGHPGPLLDQYGSELRIMGGFDKMTLYGGKEAIKSYMKSLIPYVERGGFIPFCDHFCPPDVIVEDYIFYLDLKEQMFGMSD